MINFEIWCKSFLSIYSVLPTLTDAIDRLVITKAVCSSGLYGDVIRQADTLSQLTQYKVNLINLKLLTDKTLCEMSRENARLVISRYIDCINLDDCVELSGYSKRNYFRHIGNALKEFQKIFKKKLDESNLVVKSVVKDEFWNDIFEKINRFSSCGRNVNDCPDVVCGLILNRMRKII